MTTPKRPSQDDLRRMYCEEHLSSKDISAQVGVSFSTVCKWLKKAGITLRTPGQGSKDFSWKNRGKTREFSDSWRGKLSDSGKAWAEKNASGLSFKENGYVEITRGPNKGRGLHAVVMEEHIGRPLQPDEVVHHIDRNKHNNDLSNLQLMTRAAHTRLHREEDGNEE